MHQRDVWNRIAASFDATRQRAWPHVVAFLEGLPNGVRVLDLMCGNGRHLGGACASGLDAVGLDWSAPLARTAAQHGPVVVGDATRLPFGDGTFDACIYVAGLHGIPDAGGRAASLQELRRVLSPGGLAQVTVWSRDAPRFTKMGLAPGPADVVVPWRAGGLDEQRTYHLHTRATLQAALETACFEVASLDRVAIASGTADNLVAVVRRPR